MENLQEIDPEKVLGMVPTGVQQAIIRTYREHPEYQDMDERRLRVVLNPSDHADELRICFWDEYNRAKDMGHKMVMARVYGPVMSEQGFTYFCSKSENIAWLLCQPSDLWVRMKLDRRKLQLEISNVLEKKILCNNGEVNIKLFNAYVNYFKLLSDRLDGSIVQRIAQKTETIHKTEKDVSGDPDEIRRKIAAHEAKKKEIEVKPIDE
jgi:hypothetical protein